MKLRNLAAIEAILFDWDGTLLDSYHEHTQAYLEMFHGLGIQWSVAELERHYSPDWHRIFRAVGLPRSRWAYADRLWRRAYGELSPALLPGARRVLLTLARRYQLGLVTSGHRGRIVPELQRFDLAELFAVRVCSDEARRRKPHPAPLLLALRRLRLPPEACLYVGDAAEDVEMAHRAGVRAVGVLGPFPTGPRLRAARPEALLDSIEQLPRLFQAPGEARRAVRRAGR
jgi:HAD superfamily hydrolase (TIGR01509 family)